MKKIKPLDRVQAAARSGSSTSRHGSPEVEYWVLFSYSSYFSDFSDFLRHPPSEKKIFKEYRCLSFSLVHNSQAEFPGFTQLTNIKNEGK